MTQKKKPCPPALSWYPDRIKTQRREPLGWSQGDLAAAATTAARSLKSEQHGELITKVGVSKRTIQQLEAGKSGVSNAMVSYVHHALKAAFDKDPHLTGKYSDIRRIDNNEHQSMPTEFKEATIAHLPSTSFPLARAFLNREEAYLAVAELLEKVLAGTIRKREVYLAALHGVGTMGTRTKRPQKPDLGPAVDRFDTAMHKCIMSTGANRVYVRVLFNVPDLTRLTEVQRRIQQAANADGFEARAFHMPNALPDMAPLIVGAEDGFIGVTDLGHYRIDMGIQVHGQDYVGILMEHWNHLWENEQAIMLKDPTGLRKDGFRKLRELVERSEAAQDNLAQRRRGAGRRNGGSRQGSE